METDFVFVGEALAFDFVNTQVVVRRKHVDLLASPDDLNRWWQIALTTHGNLPDRPALVNEVVLDRAKAFRQALRGLFNAFIAETAFSPTNVDQLNTILSTGYGELVVNEMGMLEHRQQTSDDNIVLLAIAQSAVWLLTDCDKSRLRKCKNEHCVLMFLDTTKNSHRVWCTTDCMNRARSSQHYRQSKT